MDKRPARHRPGTLQIIWSMIAAFCGIQNQANHDRDDDYIEEVGFRPYIIAGIALTLVVILALWLLVKWIVAA
jgi:hypothetical protein